MKTAENTVSDAKKVKSVQNGNNGKKEKSKKTGIFKSFFTSYDRLEAKWEKSGVYGIFSAFSSSKTVLRFRRSVSRSVERSAVLRLFSDLINRLPDVTLRAYGTFIFSLGLYSSLVYIIRQIASTLTSDIDSLIMGIMLMMMSVPLLFSGKTLAEAALESRIGDLVAFEILGFRREDAAARTGVGIEKRRRKRCDIAMLVGMIFGLCSFYIDLFTIVCFILASVVSYFAFVRPEFGVIMLFALAPTASENVLKAYIFILFAGYVCKLLTGRRTLRFDVSDAAMLIFLTVVRAGGIINYGNEAGGICAEFIFVYFVIVNVIKDGNGRRRIKYALVFGGILSAFVFLASVLMNESVFAPYFSQILPSLFSEHFIGLIESAAAEAKMIAPYFIMIFPMLTVSVVSRRGKGGFAFSLAGAAIVFVAVVYTWSRGLWLGALLGMIMILTAKNFNYIWIPITGAAVSPLIFLILPEKIRTFVLRVFDLSGAATLKRVQIRRTAAEIISDNLLGGIGNADGVFEAVYRGYSDFGETAANSQSLWLNIAVELGITGAVIFVLAMTLLFIKTFSSAKNSESAKKGITLYACAAGLASVLAAGLTSDIFYNDKMFLMFMLFAAFMSSYGASTCRENVQDPSTDDVLNEKSAYRDVEYR